jgi:hypothetical protein
MFDLMKFLVLSELLKGFGMGEAERAELLDSGFVYAGTDHVKLLDYGKNV